MVHLNKKQLSAQQEIALFNQLNQTLAKLTAVNTSIFLSELLGHEERIMLAKRLAAVILLLEGKSLYKTAHILKISPSTAEKLKGHIQSGTFDGIISILGKNKKDYFKFLDTLDSILHLGGILPHYSGLDRYRHL